MKKGLILGIIAVVCLGLAAGAFAQEKDTAKAKTAAPAMTGMPAGAPAAARSPMARPNFVMLYGSITSIDAKDPANVKVEVKNEMDNTTHVVTATPATNVTKVTELSELKAGDTVRVMARKVDDKEMAMGIMFGKVRKPMPRPAAGARPAMPGAPAQAPAQPVKK